MNLTRIIRKELFVKIAMVLYKDTEFEREICLEQL